MKRNPTTIWAVSTVILMAATIAPPAFADAEEIQALQAELQLLRQQMSLMAQRLQAMETRLNEANQLSDEVQKPHKNLVQPDAEAAAGSAQDTDEVEIGIKDGHLRLASKDGHTAVEIGGRLHLDGAVFHEDQASIGDGTEIRRARIYLAGKFNDWQFKNQLDFASNAVAIKDAYLRYNGLPAQITIGNHKEPFSLEELTSSNSMTFMERGCPMCSPPAGILASALTHMAPRAQRAALPGRRHWACFPKASMTMTWILIRSGKMIRASV